MVRAHYSVDRSIDEARLRWQGVDEAMDHCKFCEKLVARNKMQTHYAREHAQEWSVELEAKGRQRRAVFDYMHLDSDTRIVVQQKTSEIKTLIRHTAQDIIDIGSRLIEVKDRLEHGQFCAWLKLEFQWCDQTALNYMNVARSFNEIPNSLEFAAKALYLLASPSTPESARQEALQSPAGERITASRARKIIDAHKKAVGKFAPEIQPTVALAADALADTLNRPLTDGMIERIGETFALATATGTVAIGGENVPLTNALKEGEAEAIQRQWQHIRDNRTPPLANLETYVVTTHQDPGTLQKFVTFQVDDKTYTRLSEAQRAGRPVRLVVYEVNHD